MTRAMYCNENRRPKIPKIFKKWCKCDTCRLITIRIKIWRYIIVNDDWWASELWYKYLRTILQFDIWVKV